MTTQFRPGHRTRRKKLFDKNDVSSVCLAMQYGPGSVAARAVPTCC